jgi:hypothetical protein
MAENRTIIGNPPQCRSFPPGGRPLLAYVRWSALAHDFPCGRARIKEDLATLKKAYEDAADNGIRQVIQDWILEAEEALAEAARRRA